MRKEGPTCLGWKHKTRGMAEESHGFYRARGPKLGRAFRLNDQCYGKNCGIVCDNMTILCTHVHLGMVNNFAAEIFPFRRTEKPFSIFRVQKRGVL